MEEKVELIQDLRRKSRYKYLGMRETQQIDIFRRRMFFSYTNEPDNFIQLSVERVKEILAMNAEGKKPEDLTEKVIHTKPVEKKHDYENVVGQDSLTRFDKSKNKRRNNNKRRNGPPNENRQAAGTANAGKPNVNVNPNQNKQNPNQNKPNPNANQNKPNPNRNNNRPRPNNNANEQKKD